MAKNGQGVGAVAKVAPTAADLTQRFLIEHRCEAQGINGTGNHIIVPTLGEKG
jgi:hypothetical protein